MAASPLRHAAISAATLAWLAGGAGAWAAGAPLGRYYERTLMEAAGARCRLFTSAVMGSLHAGAAQARAAALTTGAPRAEVDGARDRALGKARAVACDNPDLRIAAQRVRAAFLSWSRQGRLDLPGRGGGWVAERPWKPGPRWALSAHAMFAGRPLTFGLARIAGPELVFAADVAAPDAARAYAARLVMRDPVRAPDPYLAPDGQPPAQAQRVVLAQARGPAPAELGAGVLLRFPMTAADDLDRLDPRENVRLELVFADPRGERTTSVLIPVGDFATGRAFLAAAP